MLVALMADQFVVFADGQQETLPLLSKDEVAARLLDRVRDLLRKRT